MNLTSALNSRIGSTDAVVPVTAPETVPQQMTIGGGSVPVVLPPRPATPTDMSRYRPVRAPEPHEVGGTTMRMYPEVDYSVEAWLNLLERVEKGAAYMREHPLDEEGYKALGLFVNLLEATQCMGIGHMAAEVLNLNGSNAATA